MKLHLMFCVCCSYVVEIGGREVVLDGCQHVCTKGFMKPQCCPQHWGPLCLCKTHTHTDYYITCIITQPYIYGDNPEYLYIYMLFVSRK